MDTIRNPTSEELKDFVPVADSHGRIRNPKAQFNELLAKKQLEANKKGLPFASHSARDDFNDELNLQIKKSIRKNGFVKPEEVKLPKIDWSKYSDLKNFELIDEGEKYDDYLSKFHKKQITVKFKKYKYKGYSNTYRVMEEPFEAVKRAK